MAAWQWVAPGTWRRQVTAQLATEIQTDPSGWNVRLIVAGRPALRRSVAGGRIYAQRIADVMGEEYAALTEVCGPTTIAGATP